MNIYHQIKNDIKRRIDEWRDLKLIRDSGFFDRNWYLAKNFDVAKLKIDPLLHYFKEGGYQGRDPGPFFCSNRYLAAYQEVRESGLNPLIHYLKYGQKKGYEAQALTIDFINSTYCIYCDSALSKYFPFSSNKKKVFCIGHNKTRTTSIKYLLENFGYKVGIQADAELLLGDWAIRDFRRIIKYCETADAFQDIPFSLDYTYQAVDHAFPGSKFILTVRNDENEWYQSLIRFYGKITISNERFTAEDLKNYHGNGKGWLWRVNQFVYGINEDNLHDEKKYKSYYLKYNSQIKEYFKNRPNDLLVINLSDSSAMKRLCYFLGIEFTGQVMPHLNKSQE